ncbi:protein Smaug homolog 1-like isoform X2 [Gigantopelta aegis]|uniref:protein Smaug homolog 1-like isoform X2 n=1 Tax=Gigantopelta aegis TaxID=1735272 RepID=UPI001B888210|nr:protein Smaug homolog 1-like isoform X2 [Gigantopelta aegis]
MKANNNFREQVTLVTNWFKTWSECEQTVALYSLLKKLTPSQAKFLVQVLQQSLSECAEAKILEERANDPVHISQLCGEYKDKAILHLLNYLPLLQSGNTLAKKEYLTVIPKVLSHAIESGVNIEESRQLLSYSLIHPAITTEERSQFRMWLGYLEERFTYSINHSRQTQSSQDSGYSQDSVVSNLSCQTSGINNVQLNGWNLIPSELIGPATGNDRVDNSSSTGGLMPNSFGHLPLQVSNSHAGAVSSPNSGHIPLHATSSAPPIFNTTVPTSQGNNSPGNLHSPLRRTYSIAPPVAIQNPEKFVSDWLRTNDDHLSQVQSAASDHAPLSPQSSVTSSGSGESHHDDGPQPIRDSFLEEGSGMRDVPVWLKSLRLHKYAYLFRQMIYEDMLNLSEEWLETQNVTKGARHKIILSIAKLRERQGLLISLEKEIMNGGSIKQAIGEMRSMLNTPIKYVSSSTVPSTPPPSPSTPDVDGHKIAEGDLPSQFIRLMGKVCTQLLCSRPDDDCFTIFLQLIDKCLNHEAFTHKQKNLLSTWKLQAQKIWQPPPHKYSDKPRKGWGNTFPLIGTSFAKQNRNPQKTSPQQWSFGTKRSVVGASPVGHLPLQRNNSLNTSLANKPGLLEGKQQVTRTHSLPIRSGPLSVSVPADQGSTDEINARLDSLCISMTEHALGSLG